MDKNSFKQWVNNNPSLVKMRESVSYPGLFVLKYTKKVFYRNLWNDTLEECRGMVIDADFNVVSRPFTKIYNFGIESSAPKLANDAVVDVYRKINGFMASITWHNNDILVSTTGSLDSDFCAMVREMIDIDQYRNVCKKYSNLTFLFECVHENDPHIIPEQVGMYLIGYREKTWKSKVDIDPTFLANVATEFGSLPVEHFKATVGEVKALIKTVKHEGFVMYAGNGISTKIKSPYYLTKKLVSRNPNTEKLMNPDIKLKIDEEYYGLIDHIQANIEEFTALTEQERLGWVRNFLETLN